MFRFQNLAPGRYALRARLEGFQQFDRPDIVLRAGDVFAVEVVLQPVAQGAPQVRTIPEAAPEPPYNTLPKPPAEQAGQSVPPETPAPDQKVFTPVPNRWNFDWPNYRRYGPTDEAPFIPRGLLDPFNRNKLKGDYPVIGNNIFLNISLTSDTAVDRRELPASSNLGAASPDTQNFFGKFGQSALSQDFAFSFDLFHGDTSFRPFDWRVKITPDINVNYLAVQEDGIVSPDERAGTTRLDAHLGLQEAFVEAKLMDLSHNYDFTSARAGIQTFNSDFRGFIFFDQEPGLRIFGNLGSNRYQYNAAYFAMLEKDTNSGLNSMAYRSQQVLIGNLYRQDFIKPGYNIQASFHYDKDDPSFQLDTDHFVVRPAPIGTVTPHSIRAYYYGLTGDGHIGRLNLTHAFYQVLGHDSLNQIAGRYTNINAQMAAVELSIDKDWLRFRTSLFFASGDKNPRGGTARGFDSIMDNSNFAGGFFSFWNREGIRLSSTGVGLTPPGSLLPDLRTSKIEGQANFVNPGIFIYNTGMDVEITPRLRGVLNLNLIRFVDTEPLELLLFQPRIHAGVGADSGVGLKYRPALSENIEISGAFNTLTPFQGFRDIYTGKTLFSLAANVRFHF